MLYIAAMLLIWLLVTLFTASSVMAVYSSSRAVTLNPFNARARAELANDMVYATGDRGQIGAAAAQSRMALESNPTLAGAYRMIALDNLGAGKAVKPAILAATYLTRRDYIANLWLIEDAVKRERMDEAMAHVDASLRTSRRGQALLFPILAKAMVEPAMKPHFVKVFGGNPDWLPNFLSYYIGTKQPAAPLAQVMAGSRDELPASFHSTDAVLIGMMVGQHDFDAAWQFERAIAKSGTVPSAGQLRYPHFEQEGAHPPLDWRLAREAAYGADIEKTAKGNRLVVVSDEQKPSEVARQIVRLTPGTYRLEVRGRLIDGNDDAQAIWRVACAEAGSAGNQAEVVITRDTAATPATFTVAPDGCTAHWVILSVATGFGTSPLQAEFWHVDLQRQG